jgi:hypothetical protein
MSAPEWGLTGPRLTRVSRAPVGAAVREPLQIARLEGSDSGGSTSGGGCGAHRPGPRVHFLARSALLTVRACVVLPAFLALFWPSLMLTPTWACATLPSMVASQTVPFADLPSPDGTDGTRGAST